jgi:hypothetical protein
VAIYLEFTKAAETETEVEYLFGGAEDPTGHRVTILKADPSQTVLPEGISQALTGKVIGRAAVAASREGAWPQRGLIQS